MQIINNFILPYYQDKIENILTSNQFPYFYGENTVNLNLTNTYFIDNKTSDDPQFTHILVENGNINSNYFSLYIKRIIDKLEEELGFPCKVLRCKVNLNIKSTNIGTYNTPHIDNLDTRSITAIYYVNTSDGNTYFFDKKYGSIIKEITPTKGTLVWWRGLQFHAKASPSISNKRIVININLLPEE